MKLNIRRVVTQEDVAACRQMLPEGCTEPDWFNCLLLERDGEVVAVGGTQVICRIEPLFVKNPKDSVAWLALVCELEGSLRRMGATAYEFFIQDRFQDYQKFVEKHFAVSPGREAPGKTYIRRLE